MAGILLCDLSSWYLANDWAAMLARFGLSGYHASDFHGRRGDFKGWSADQAAEFQDCVVNLLLKWEVKHGAVGIPWDDFRRSFADTGFHKRLLPAVSKWKKPYLYAFQHMVADLRKYADHQPKGYYIRPIFDRCQEFIGQAEKDYASINRDGKLGRMYVSDTREFVQLQAADFLAWEYRIHTERRLSTGDHSPNRVMDSLMPHMFNAQIWTFDYLEYLRKRVEAIEAGQDPERVEPPQG